MKALGTLRQPLSGEVSVVREGDAVGARRVGRRERPPCPAPCAPWVNNMVTGVTKGFERKLTPGRGLSRAGSGRQAQPCRSVSLARWFTRCRKA